MKAAPAAVAVVLLVAGLIAGAFALAQSGTEDEGVLSKLTPPPDFTPGLPEAHLTPAWAMTPTPAPEATIPKEPCPEGIHPEMTMRLEGPAEAKPEQEATYTLSYDLVDRPETAVRIGWSPYSPPYVTYAGARRLSGGGAPGPMPAAATSDGQVQQLEWPVEKGPGALEITLSIPQDVRVSEFSVYAWVTGNCAPRSNSVITAIVPG